MLLVLGGQLVPGLGQGYFEAIDDDDGWDSLSSFGPLVFCKIDELFELVAFLIYKILGPFGPFHF